jgi:serine phosphatase RsbU (regulator of sigma subunit)
MSESAPDPDPAPPPPASRAEARPHADARRHADGRRRADAVASRERILAAAAVLLGDRRTTMSEVAAAADVGRSTLYRHFPTRQALAAALAEQVDDQPREAARDEPSGRMAPLPYKPAAPDEPSGRLAPLPYQPPGALGRDRPLALEVTQVLDEVPPHLIADQLVAEARRAAGVAVALYIVDIDGSQLVRLAGSEDFPERLEAPPALGPEIVPEGLPTFYEQLRRRLPRCTAWPLWLRGRVIGLLLSVGQPIAPLEDIARQGAAALELANDYTDLIESVRRHKPTTAAAEVQYHLLPPRVARITGAHIAGGLLPAYQVGGDWFDFVENRDGAWLAIADAAGTGPTAAGLSASALGALRAARRSGQDLVQAALTMDEVIRALANENFAVTAILARWHAPTATLAWINCGHPPPHIADAEGAFTVLDGPLHPALGSGDAAPTIEVSAATLQSGDRVVLVTDGITQRRVEGGGHFGVEGLRRAVQGAQAATAAATAMAVQQAVSNCWSEPLEDDATLVVLAVD